MTIASTGFELLQTY